MKNFGLLGLLLILCGSASGKFVTASNPLLDVPRGRSGKMSAVNKFGANLSVTADAREDVWDGGGTYSFPATALITKVSQKVNQAAMVGATIELQGLDADWSLVVQTVALNGSDTTTAVTLDTPLIRVFRMKVLANVVGDQNITAHNDADDHDYAVITAGNNQTLMAIYTVPAGYTAYLTKYYCTVVDATSKTPTSTRFGLWMANRKKGYEFQLKHQVGVPSGGNMVEHSFVPYSGGISEKTDIKITASPLDQAADVAAGFDLILVKN